MSKFRNALVLALAISSPALLAQSVSTPNNQWTALPYPSTVTTDASNDQQTGQGESDLIGGYYGLAAVYTKFSAGTTSTNGTIAFRLRLAKDSSPVGFKSTAVIGVDGNGDGVLDVFVGVDNSGTGDSLKIWAPGPGANNTPATTSIDPQTPYFVYSPTTANYNWQTVTAVSDPAAGAVASGSTPSPFNLDGATGTGQTDYFLSFSVPFADFISALNSRGITGITSNSILNYVAATATQPNTLNQDINGITGGLSSTTTFTTLGVITPPVLPTGNRQPVAQADSASTMEDTVLNNLNVLSNDADPDGDTLTVTTASSPNGTVTINGNGTLNFTPAANFNGATTIGYAISDGRGGTATSSVAVTVTAVNDAPVAVNDTATATEDTVLNNINVLGNDTDVDGDALTVTTASSPNGTVTINGNGTLNFTPTANFSGATTIGYAISDGRGGTTTGSVAVTVTAVNDAPVAVNDTATTTEDVALNNINVLGNDTDVDGDALTVTTASSPNGTVTINGNGTLNFTPTAYFRGATTISYTISDGRGGTSTASVAMTVTAMNRAPVAANNSATTTEDTAVNNINVLGNDTDVDGDTLTVTTASSPNGTVTINGDGTLNFTPAANFNGATAISYAISDGRGGTATASVAVTVTAVNDAPVAVNDTATATEDIALNNINVLGNDSDVDGDTLTVTTASSPNGTVTINGDGTLNFTPSANFTGPTTISYTLSDGNGSTASGTVAVTVTAANDAPVAANDAATTTEDTALFGINVLANDGDTDGDTLTSVSATSPNGTATINLDGTLNFTPAANFNGATTISYTISDGRGGTSTASVAVTVIAVNDAPVAATDTAMATEDIALDNINVLGNDSDADGDIPAVTSATSPNGTVTINGDGTLNFTPAANFSGLATITYALSDGRGGTATATVAVTVTAVNDAPVAANNTASATKDTVLLGINVLANDTDVDGDPLTVTTASSPNGTVTINTDGTLNFTPAPGFIGATTISYTLSDGHGGTATATVAVTVNAMNHPPIARSDAYIVPATPAPFSLAVLANDSDLDGDTLAVLSLTGGANGSVTTDGTLVFYTPGSGFADFDTFTYTVSDGRGGTTSATVRIVSDVQVTTSAASSITPSAAMLNAQLNPRTLDSALTFEYSTSPTLATFSTSASAPAGNGNVLVAGSVPIAGLQANTRYYYRAILTNEAGIFSGEIKSFLTPTFVWGPSGTTTASGQLDATRIPNTGTSTLFRNISGLGYDVAINTNGLGGNGFTSVTGTPSWWFGGSAPSAAEGATVGFRFFDAGTINPRGVIGVRFQIDDAEQMETLLNFHYFTATGEKIFVPWTSPIFSYSHTPTFGSSGATVENGAPYAGLTQSGKWVDINLSGISVSGFEFQFKRRTLSAGTIIMGPVSCEREVLAVGGNFTPHLLSTDASGFASLPDYTTQAILTGTGAGPGVIVTQSPAAGSPLPVGKREILIHAEDAQGNQANTGFTIVINDKTGPSATIANGAPTTLTSPDPMPNYAPYVTFRDNVGVVRIVQSPAPGTMTSIGTSAVILTAYDAAGNTGTATIQLTVQSATGGTTPLLTSSAVSGAGTHGVPAGAVFKFFGVPSINGTRSVAFTAAWVKGTQVGNSLFSGNPAQPIATLKEAAPGIAGAAFSKFQDPVLNSGGTEGAVAFSADVTGPNITSLTNGGVWTNLGGTLQLLARESSPAPGTASLFKKFDSISMVGDEVLIVATLGGIGAFPENDAAVWRWTPARGMQLVLREGQKILGNHTLATFQMLGAVSSSSGHGRHHLDTGYYAARITCTNRCNAAVFIDFTSNVPVVIPLGKR